MSELVLRSSEDPFSQGRRRGIASYQDKARKLMNGQASGFRSDTVNVLMMHCTMDGATLSGSEYRIHSGRDDVVDPIDILARSRTWRWGTFTSRRRYAGTGEE